MPETTEGDKIFPATPRKRREARDKGMVARSIDLSSAAVLLGVIAAVRLCFSNGIIANTIFGTVRQCFAFDPHSGPPSLTTLQALRNVSVSSILELTVPILCVGALAGFLVSVAQVGMVVSPSHLAPDWSRVSPATGFKRLFSIRSMLELCKSIAKVSLIAWLCYSTAVGRLPQLQSAAVANLSTLCSVVGQTAWDVGIRVATVLVIIAIADYAFQKFDLEKNLRMTRQELKQEMKHTDGDPLIKNRIRQRQRALSQRRMMQQVPKADVIVANPDHFAVALKYDSKEMTAPKVVAKGQDLIALKIKEIARENKVPIVEQRELARSLFYQVRLGAEVPADLYRAVAEVLAFVYRTYRKSSIR